VVEAGGEGSEASGGVVEASGEGSEASGGVVEASGEGSEASGEGSEASGEKSAIMLLSGICAMNGAAVLQRTPKQPDF
jgi:hypothetical protein